MQHKKKIKLEEIEKRQMFTVPEKYFEDLPANIRRRLNTTQVQKKPSFAWVRYSVSIASVCLILLAGYFWLLAPASQDTYQIISAVTDTEIIDYLQTNDLSHYDMIETAADADITIDSQFFQKTDINPQLLIDEADEELIQDYI